MSYSKAKQSKPDLGFYVSLFGTTLILLWVGLFKFTHTEAESIKPLVINHPLTFWMYDIMSTQVVSYFIGISEIAVALLILVGLKYKIIAKIASLGVLTIFLMTISYLFTTPGTWKTIDGFFITNFFILKDIMYIGFGLSLYKYACN